MHNTSLVPRPLFPAFVAAPLFTLQVTKTGHGGLGTRLAQYLVVLLEPRPHDDHAAVHGEGGGEVGGGSNVHATAAH